MAPSMIQFGIETFIQVCTKYTVRLCMKNLSKLFKVNLCMIRVCIMHLITQSVKKKEKPQLPAKTTLVCHRVTSLNEVKNFIRNFCDFSSSHVHRLKKTLSGHTLPKQ